MLSFAKLNTVKLNTIKLGNSSNEKEKSDEICKDLSMIFRYAYYNDNKIDYRYAREVIKNVASEVHCGYRSDFDYERELYLDIIERLLREKDVEEN